MLVCGMLERSGLQRRCVAVLYSNGPLSCFPTQLSGGATYSTTSEDDPIHPSTRWFTNCGRYTRFDTIQPSFLAVVQTEENHIPANMLQHSKYTHHQTEK